MSSLFLNSAGFFSLRLRRGNSSVTVWVARSARFGGAGCGRFRFQNMQEPLEPPVAQPRPVSTGNGCCGSRRQKIAVALSAFFGFHCTPITPAPYRDRGSQGAAKTVAPAVHTPCFAGLSLGSSRARGSEKRGRFFQHLRTCSCDRRNTYLCRLWPIRPVMVGGVEVSIDQSSPS